MVLNVFTKGHGWGYSIGLRRSRILSNYDFKVTRPHDVLC